MGIIGCGGITAFAHVPALCTRDDVEIAYLCDVELRRAEVTRARFGLEAACCVADYHQVLDDPSVEAIIVASWPSNHVEIALQVIASGRHLLIQKPLTLTAHGAEQLLKAASSSEKNILALPLIEAIPSFEDLRSLIRSRTLGSMTFARIRTTISGPDDYYADVKEFFHESREAQPPYRRDGYASRAGSIADMGPYALSAFYYLFGPGRLRFARGTPATYDRCTLLVMDVEGCPGAVGDTPFCSIETGWEQVKGREVCTVFGSSATACIESTGRLVLLQKDGAEEVIGQLQGHNAPLPIAPLDAQDRWVAAILAGREAAFRETVESAVWVSKVIAEVLATRQAGAEASRE